MNIHINDHFTCMIFRIGSGTQSNMNANEVISNRVYIHTNIYIYTCIYKYTYIYMYMHTYMHTYASYSNG
jgi:hypothetical protein